MRSLHLLCFAGLLGNTVSETSLKYYKSWEKGGMDKLKDKYFGRPHVSYTGSDDFILHQTYSDCRNLCLDGGGAHGSGKCEMMIFAESGCKNWEGGLIQPLCLMYDGDNHGQDPNVVVEESTRPGPYCSCGLGDSCEIFEKVENDLSQGMIVVISMQVVLIVIGIILITLQWRRSREVRSR